MVYSEHISRLLEELRTSIASLQSQPDGDEEKERLTRLVVQVSTILTDLRREHRANPEGERWLALHYAVSHLLLTAPNIDEAAAQLLQTISEFLGCSYGGFWYIDADANIIKCKAIWHRPGMTNSAFIHATLQAAFTPGEDLPGQVWATGEPLWIAEIDNSSASLRQLSARHAGLQSALALPLQAGSKILGVIEFFVAEPYIPDYDILYTLAVIGNQTGQFIERQQVQAELTKTQSHLDLILEQMPAAVIIAEAPSGRLVLGNAQVEQIWRHPFLRSSSINDYQMWQGFHLDGRPYQPEEWPIARAVTTGERVRGEEILTLRGDGTRGVVRVSAAPIHDTSGEIIAGVVVFDDISAEHQAIERALRLQTISGILSKALTPAQVGDVIVNQAITTLDASAGSLVLLKADKTALEVIGTTGATGFVNERFKDMPIDTLLPLPVAVQTGEAIFIENIAHATDRFPDLSSTSNQSGSSALAALPLRVDDRVIGALGLSFQQTRVFEPEDRTFMLTLAGQCALALERARLYRSEQEARQRAEAAQRRLAFLAEASQVLASSLDYQTTLAHVARLALPELADWAGTTLVEPDGSLNIVAITHVDAEKESLIHEYLHRYPLNPEATTGTMQVIRTGVSEMVEHLPAALIADLPLGSDQKQLLQTIGIGAYMCVPLYNGDQTLGALSFGADDSRTYTADDLALAEELGRRCAVAIQNARLYHNAQQAIRVRDEFLTMASHELRTPLTALLGMSHMLEKRVSREASGGDRVTRGITVIARQATRLKRLIDQMFDLSRIETDHLDLSIRQFDLSALIRQVVEESRTLLQRHTIELHCPDTLCMDGDEDRLEQVLQNLLYNAVKYSPDGGTITASVVPHEQSVKIAIADQGIGIPDAARGHVFKRFYRASNSALRNISGLGIGLYIVKEIVQRHGGTIDFCSTEGQGTTFMISLPLRAAPAAQTLSCDPQSQQRGHTPA